MDNNITNYIVIGLIAIVLVLFLYYNNPLVENVTTEGFYEEPEEEPGETVPKSLKREYVKTILSLDKINIDTNKVDAIKKKIKFTTRKIKDVDTDYIDIYDIEDDIENGISKLDKLENNSKNPNIKQFVRQIRLIGNEDGDFTKVDRNKDFYLNMINGISIDIDFVNNYNYDLTDTIQTETLVNESLPINFEGTVEDEERYKDYSFKTCIVEISKSPVDDAVVNEYRDIVILTLEKEINIGDNNDDNTYNYLDVLNKDIDELNKSIEIDSEKKVKCKSIFVIQKCVIKIVLNKGTIIDSKLQFKKFVENINIPESSFSYELGFRYIPMVGQEIILVKGIYKVELYLNNVEYQTSSMNTWLQNKINKENEVLLNKKLENIITPMFDLDNEIEKRSKVVKRIHDIYRFNKLNNSRNTMRFYNSHY